MTKITQAQVEKLVNEAIEHDLKNESVVKNALAHAVMIAAGEIGRFDALNRLFRGVSNSTAEGIRLYMVNLIEDTGIKVLNSETGVENLVSFFTFKKADGYNFVPKEKRTDNHKKHRENVAAMSIEQLMAIPLGARKRETVDSRAEFDFAQFETRMQNLLKKAVTEGAINTAQLDQFNKLLSAGKRVDLDAINKAEDERIERARKVLEKAGLSVVPVDNSNVKAA